MTSYSRNKRISDLLEDLNRRSNQGTYLPPSKNRIFGAPPLLPGEAFSSWVWRIQAQLKVSISFLLESFELRLDTFWLDTGISENKLGQIADTLSIPASDLVTLSYPLDSFISEPELACLTTVPLYRRGLYRYCSMCLSQDEIPYIRQLWRLSCTYLCPIHRLPLTDFCFSCREPLSLTTQGRKRTIRECSTCGVDLSRVHPKTLPPHLQFLVLGKQVELLNLIAAGSKLLDIPFFDATRIENSIVKREGTEIDLTDEDTAFHIFQGMLFRLHQGEVRNSRQLRIELDEYLEKVEFPTGQVSVGFDGWRLFGDAAPVVVGHLQSSQSPWGGTYWWGLDRRGPYIKEPGFTKNGTQGLPEWINGLKSIEAFR